MNNLATVIACTINTHETKQVKKACREFSTSRVKRWHAHYYFACEEENQRQPPMFIVDRQDIACPYRLTI